MQFPKLYDPANPPSWVSSTLSEMAMLSLMTYLVAAVVISIKTKDIAPIKWAAEVFGASYLTARSGNGGGQPPAQPTEPEK